MARKRVERNIAFDDLRRRYYVVMDRGKNKEGKRLRTCTTLLVPDALAFSIWAIICWR